MKTQVTAEAGKQEIVVTREFDLPVELLYKAYTEAELLEQWMGTKVMKLENKPHGSYHFITTDYKGNEHGFNGTIHEIEENRKITRTFEMEHTPFSIQLEFLDFEALTEETSKLTILSVFRSVAHRDEMLKMPFAQGANWAHNRLQEIAEKLK